MNNGLILGFFDGVHIAHQAVINSAKEYADNTILITFKDSPAKYFQRNYEYIYSRENSVKKIKSLGVNQIIELDFKKVANMQAEEYLEYITKEFKPISISTGYNHTFGKNRIGNSEFLQNYSTKLGYKYFCIPEQKYNDEIISSTLIKKYLKEGNIKIANILLGSSFKLQGTVIEGAQIGRTIGFPTANINYPQEIVKIPFGVYYAKYQNKKCILNWGMKPTVHNTEFPVAELHILDFDEDLYNKTIEFEILQKIRDEKRFNNINELREQIIKDTQTCLEL